MRAVLAATVVAVLGVQGCSAGLACTDMGGFHGVGAEIPRSLFVPTGEAAFEVCDPDGCASATQRLGRVPEGPVGRGASVTFDDLGREFGPGEVDVTVRISGPDGSFIAVASRDVDLERSYPNGEDCDGEGYVGGTLVMRASDRVRSGSDA